MTSLPSSRAMTLRRVSLVVATALAGALTLSACGGSSKNASANASDPPTASASGAGAGAGSGPGFGRDRGPAASGIVAAISGSTAQVQNPQSGQVAVTWTASTSFTQQTTTSLASVKPGDCVSAVGPQGTTPTATSFTATSLTVSSPVNGSCTGGFRGPGNGQRPSGFPTNGQRPSGFPTGSRPSGFPSGARGNFGALAVGTVTSVSGSSVVIAARQFGSDSTTNKTISVGSSTKITTTTAAKASAVKVGKCLTAQGKADSSGAVTATNVHLSDAVNGQCGGFTHFGGGGIGG